MHLKFLLNFIYARCTTLGVNKNVCQPAGPDSSIAKTTQWFQMVTVPRGYILLVSLILLCSYWHFHFSKTNLTSIHNHLMCNNLRWHFIFSISSIAEAYEPWGGGAYSGCDGKQKTKTAGLLLSHVSNSQGYNFCVYDDLQAIGMEHATDVHVELVKLVDGLSRAYVP